MTIWESILLGIALCFDTLAVSATCSIKSRIPIQRGMLMALIFALFQGGFPLIGALIGTAAEQLVSSLDHWVAFGLLALVGGNMIRDAFSNKKEDDNFDISKFGVIITLAVATSIDAFVVGIGFGLHSAIHESLLTCLIIGIVTFIAAMIGQIIGRIKLPFNDRIATLIGGLVLIALGTKTLIEHLGILAN
ncbi:MAG: manganese efflux pump MntP family protein [Bacteroidales bacterium]|nr:manganese efflux pump MntP family protein [Bacteroidales bacterium]